mgnify:CR=1 FL=1
MDEKKSVDEKILAVRNQLILCGDAMLFAYHMLVDLRYGTDVGQEKFDQVTDDLLTAFRSTLDLSSTVYDLAYGNGKE